jgi:formylglycine-generating enzyme required for sulfatase activity
LALTQNYLQRKIETWVTHTNGDAMRREIEFARVKHPQLLITIMHGYPDWYAAAAGMPAVISFRSNSDFDAYMEALAPPNYYRIDDLAMTFINIPAGSFQMGSLEGVGNPNERPQHTVTLDGFQMMTTEVTQKQWWDVMGQWPADGNMAPYISDGLGDNYPIYDVSWCDIVGAEGDAVNCGSYTNSFLKRLNEQHGGSNPYKGDGTDIYRLPTEAEWEYAARAGTTTTYACPPDSGIDGNSTACLDAMGWYSDNNTPNGTKPVGGKLANAWSLYDMHGNVSEWVQDWFNGAYSGDTQYNPTGASTGAHRGLRGGGWPVYAVHARSASRNGYTPNSRLSTFGFRLVRRLL